jgi:transposase
VVIAAITHKEVFMAHRNARLNVHGRRLIVQRVRGEGWAVAHVAKAMGISRQCAHRWLARYDTEGDAGLVDRSSRPHVSPKKTPPEVEAKVIEARRRLRQGPGRLGPEVGVAPRTVTRILGRNHIPRLSECDPLTGTLIRSSKATAVRYEREHPGDLVHVDVKKIGRIPDGGGWRAWGRGQVTRNSRVGYVYDHSAVDDHSRLAYSEIRGDETGDTCAGFMLRAAAWFQTQGIDQISQVMTDNHWSYTKRRLRRGSRPDRCRAHHDPSALSMAERQSRTVQPDPPNRMGIPASVHHKRTALQGAPRLAQLLQL